MEASTINALITAIGSLIGGLFGAYATLLAAKIKNSNKSTQDIDDTKSKSLLFGVITGAIAGAFVMLLVLVLLGFIPFSFSVSETTNSPATVIDYAESKDENNIEQLPFKEDFQDNKDDFVELVGNWKIIEDSSEAGNLVIQITPNASNPDSAYITFGPKNLTDFTIEYRFKYINLNKQTDNWVWFVFHTDYAMSCSPYYDVLDIIDFSNDDDWIWLIQFPTTYKTNNWYSVRVESTGSNVKFYLDGNLLGRLRDMRVPATSKRLKLYVGSDVTVQFDDILLKAP